MNAKTFAGFLIVLAAALAWAFFAGEMLAADFAVSFGVSAAVSITAWLACSKFVSSRSSIGLNETLWKDSLSFLPFTLLFFIFLKGLAATISSGNWEVDAAALSINLMAKVLLVCSITAFASIKVFLLPAAFRNPFPNLLKKINPKKTLLAMVLIYFVSFIILTFIRFLTFKTPSPDLWIFNQAMWNTLHGSFMVTTRMLELGNQVLLGDHFFLVLLFLLPLYALAQGPLTLYFIETLFISLAAVPLYKLAKLKFNDGRFALVFPLAYLLYPALHFINLAEFQPVAFAIPFFLFSFYFLKKRDTPKFFMFLLLALSVRETSALIGVFYGIFIAVVQRRPKLGAAVSALSLAWFLAAVLFVIPALGPAYQYVGGTQNAFPNFGDTPDEVLAGMANPVKVFQEATTVKDIGYLLLLFSPVAFLCLLSPAFAIPLPMYALNLLSGLPQHGNIFFQYNAEIIPFIFAGAVFGAARALRLIKRIFPGNRRAKQAIAVAILAGAVLSGILYGPTPLSLLDPLPNQASFDFREYAFTAHHGLIHGAISLIPGDASVSCDNMFTGPLSSRAEVYYFPYHLDTVDYALVDTTIGGHASTGAAKGDLDALMENGDFEQLVNEDGVILFKRIR